MTRRHLKKISSTWYTQFDMNVLEKFLIGKKVIELGCYKGAATERLVKSCQELIVVEAAKTYITYVSDRLKEYSNCTFIHSTWQDFDYAASDISDVVFFMGLQYLDRKDAKFVLRKIKSFLEPDGRLHIVVPNARSLHRRIAYYMGLIDDVHVLSDRNNVRGHRRVYDNDILHSELKECGFNVSHWEGVFLKPFPDDMMSQIDENVLYGLCEIGRELPDYCAHLYALCVKC